MCLSIQPKPSLQSFINCLIFLIFYSFLKSYKIISKVRVARLNIIGSLSPIFTRTLLSPVFNCFQSDLSLSFAFQRKRNCLVPEKRLFGHTRTLDIIIFNELSLKVQAVEDYTSHFCRRGLEL